MRNTPVYVCGLQVGAAYAFVVSHVAAGSVGERARLEGVLEMICAVFRDVCSHTRERERERERER